MHALLFGQALSSPTVKTVNRCDKATVVTGLAFLSFLTYAHRSEGLGPDCQIQREYSDSLDSPRFIVIVALTAEIIPILFNTLWGNQAGDNDLRIQN